jgi:hypothetical protein
MREAKTQAMPAIVEEERQSKQDRPARRRRSGGLPKLTGIAIAQEGNSAD